MWHAWRLDGYTWSWIVWIAAFVVLETAAIRAGYWGTLTAHLRPLFVWQPWFWWMGVGLWTAAGVHIFAPALERWIIDTVGRGTP